MRWRLDDGQIEVLDEAQAEVLRQKTPCERVGMILGSNRTMRLLIRGRLLTRHPEWDEAQVSAEVARRMSRGTG